jgi:hypothetical protein
MPGSDSNTSVARILAQDNEQLCKLGTEYRPDQRIPKGYARLCVADIQKLELSVYSSEPPRLHADISNWPPADEESARLVIADQLFALQKWERF